VALPARDDSGQQNLRFAIENVTGEAMLAIDAAMAEGAEVTLVYREDLASDLSAPASKPLTMLVVGTEFEGSTVQFRGVYRPHPRGLSRPNPRQIHRPVRRPRPGAR